MNVNLVHENKYVVYRHIRLDTNVPFYVGIGLPARARNLRARNVLHKRIQKLTSIKIEIVACQLTRLEAASMEIRLIALYRKFGYCIANFTAGGDGGQLGVKHSKETIAKLKYKAKLRLSKPENNPMFGRFGRNNPKYGKTCVKQSLAMSGRRGKEASNFQGIWHCAEFGSFESSNLAAQAIGITSAQVKYRAKSNSRKFINWKFEKQK